MKVKSVFMLMTFFLSSMLGCQLFHDIGILGSVLELSDVDSFKIQQQTTESHVQLRISGLVFRSSYVISSVDSKVNGDVLTVLVHLALAKKGASGNLDYNLSIPDVVNEVRFGNKATIIWTRKK